MNLQIQHIAKKFHNGTKALADVDFSVSQGEFVSVIGPSGAGKTTLVSHSQWNDGVHWRAGASG